MAQKDNATELVDHFFRSESGKLVAHLTSKFGPIYLEEAEDAVQEALVKAMQSWSIGKIPDNPAAWVFKVAHNHLINQLRKKQKVFYSTQYPEEGYNPKEISEDFFTDDIIKMIFACCNPSLSTEHQLILTLKILGGLSIREIASALLKKEESIAKSYTRAKKKFREENLKLEIPDKSQIIERLQIVLKTIYLIFNEGYKSSEGNELIRLDLCEEAMRLNHILLGKNETNNDWTRSLMALMHYHSARFTARTNQEGDLITLKDQNRKLWDFDHITLGNKYLNSVINGTGNSYFLQAAISGIHSSASSYEKTDWKSILSLYDSLLTISPNPVVKLNRIVPFSKVHGASKGLIQLRKIATKSLEHNYLLPAISAELHLELKDLRSALRDFRQAYSLCKNLKEKEFLGHKIHEVESEL